MRSFSGRVPVCKATNFFKSKIVSSSSHFTLTFVPVRRHYEEKHVQVRPLRVAVGIGAENSCGKCATNLAGHLELPRSSRYPQSLSKAQASGWSATRMGRPGSNYATSIVTVTCTTARVLVNTKRCRSCGYQPPLSITCICDTHSESGDAWICEL